MAASTTSGDKDSVKDSSADTAVVDNVAPPQIALARKTLPTIASNVNWHL